MLSARELDLEPEPARGRLRQPADRLHARHRRRAWCRSTRSTNEGQPRLFIRNLPPVSSEGRAGDHRAADLLRREAERLRHHRRPAGRVRLPDRRRARAGPDPGTETRWRGTTGIDLDTTLPRLLFALRFRDLDLLISDQITAESQLLFHRSLARPAGPHRAVPALRQGSVPRDPRRRRPDLRAGRVHRVRPLPARAGLRPGRIRARGATRLGDPFNYIRNSVKITMDAYDGTMQFYVADDQDPIIRAYSGVFPTMFQPLTRHPGGPARRTCGSPRSCSTSRRASSGGTTSATRCASSRATTCGRSRRRRAARSHCPTRRTT